MAIIAKAQQNQVVSIDGFAALCRQNIKMIFIFTGCNLRDDFTAHARNRFFRDSCGHEETFIGHPEVALRVIRWHTTFIAKCDSNQLPWQIAGDRREPCVDRSRSIPARESNPEFVPLANRFARLIDDEIRCVGAEILRSNYVATHCATESNRTMRLAALFQIALMIFVRAPEPWRRFNLRYYRLTKAPALADLFSGSFCC